ncbi:MAG: ABC transporter substrate-binding protein [Acidimicrobiales bacterium]|jgi:peptide/nickel transport system substrate-binding protein
MARRKSTLRTLLASVAAFLVLVAACGDADAETDQDDASNVRAPVTEPVSNVEVSTELEVTDSSGEDRSESRAEVTHGGFLHYGIETDTSRPWTHYDASCATSCRMILRSVSDALFITASDGQIVPYLVESVQSSQDLATWSMTIREGIFFHDGTALDGAAVKYNLDTCRHSAINGPSFIGLVDVVADGQLVHLTYAAPEAFGPLGLRTETCGLMFSPAWLSTLATNPLNRAPFVTAEEAAEIDMSGDPAAPVGLGAFVFESYEPGNRNSFVATRNPNYWRGENGVTGETLPYLDGVEFTVVDDILARSNGLKAGQFDIIHTANADEIASYQAADDFKLLQATEHGETSYTLINVAAGDNPTIATLIDAPEYAMDPSGLNAANPLVHLSCRKALAHAIDGQRLADARGAGIAAVANGPFPPGSIGYLEDTGYPVFDLQQAAADFEICKVESEQNPVTFGFDTTRDPFDVETNQLMVEMWTAAFGSEISVAVSPFDQGALIDAAIAGNFDAQSWRNHAGVDPAEQWYWWHSATARAIAEPALNFGRFQDPAIDAQIAVIRGNADPDLRRAAAEKINRLFGANVWNWWTTWTVWGLVANPRLQNLTNLTIPGTSLTTFPVIAGKHHLTQIWCLSGDCQG